MNLWRKQLMGIVAGISMGAAVGWAVTLDECVKTALMENPDVSSARSRVEASAAARKQAQSAYYPRVNLSAGYSQTDNAGQALFLLLNQRAVDFQSDLNHPDSTDNIRGSVTAQYRILDGGRRGLDVQLAKQGEAVAGESLDALRNQLVHEVTRSFYSVLQARALGVVQAEAVRSLEESLRLANERLAAGSSVKTDVLTLEVQLAQAKEDLIRVNHGVELAMAVLNVAMGKDVVTSNNISEPERRAMTPPPAKMDMSALDAQRAELKASTLMEKIRHDQWQRARREYYPVVNAFGSYDQDWGGSDREDSTMVGVMAEWNIFDGQQTRGAVAQARAEYQAASAERRKALQQIRLDATQAFLGVKDAWERWQVMERSLENAKEALRITRELYLQGGADISTLLTAQVGLTATSTRHVSAYYDYQIALSNLERARGVLSAKYPLVKTKSGEGESK